MTAVMPPVQEQEQPHIVLLAHSPLASAWRATALHVFANAGHWLHAIDVPANEAPEESLQRAQAALGAAVEPDEPGEHAKVLVLADIPGATPCNVAQRLAQAGGWPLLAGINMPLLLRAISYSHEPSVVWVQRALEGGHNGLVQLQP